MYTNQIIGEWQPHTDSTFLMETSGRMEGAVLVTYGQDSEQQMKTTYIKLWEVTEVADYSKLSNNRLTQRLKKLSLSGLSEIQNWEYPVCICSEI